LEVRDKYSSDLGPENTGGDQMMVELRLAKIPNGLQRVLKAAAGRVRDGVPVKPSLTQMILTEPQWAGAALAQNMSDSPPSQPGLVQLQLNQAKDAMLTAAAGARSELVVTVRETPFRFPSQQLLADVKTALRDLTGTSSLSRREAGLLAGELYRRNSKNLSEIDLPPFMNFLDTALAFLGHETEGDAEFYIGASAALRDALIEPEKNYAVIAKYTQLASDQIQLPIENYPRLEAGILSTVCLKKSDIKELAAEGIALAKNQAYGPARAARLAGELLIENDLQNDPTSFSDFVKSWLTNEQYSVAEHAQFLAGLGRTRSISISLEFMAEIITAVAKESATAALAGETAKNFSLSPKKAGILLKAAFTKSTPPLTATNSPLTAERVQEFLTAANYGPEAAGASVAEIRGGTTSPDSTDFLAALAVGLEYTGEQTRIFASAYAEAIQPPLQPQLKAGFAPHIMQLTEQKREETIDQEIQKRV
jgi:hypothetical protein